MTTAMPPLGMTVIRRFPPLFIRSEALYEAAKGLTDADLDAGERRRVQQQLPEEERWRKRR